MAATRTAPAPVNDRGEYLPSENDQTPARLLPSPLARPLSALLRPDYRDEGELLLHRYLCRQGTLLLCGPTGVGKSALAMQLALCWALERAAFGIAPARPLLSLVIQAENDEADLAEMRDGVLAGLALSPGDAAQATGQVLVCREDTRCGVSFFPVVRALLAEYRPDLLWIDPVLSYLGGDANTQKDVGKFLRNGLNPLIREFDCGCVEIHHTNKPAVGREKPDWRGGDYAYLGAGSAEWANHARAVLALRSIGSRQIFELQAGKRGGRLGWRDGEGQTAYSKYLAHWREPGVICWRDVDLSEIEIGGRPKSCDVAELLAVLPGEGLSTGDWEKLARSECGISRATFHRQRQALAKANRVLKSKVSNKWQPINKA